MQAVTSQYQPYQPYQAAIQDFNPMKGMCYNCGGDHFAKECAGPAGHWVHSRLRRYTVKAWTC